MFSPDRAGFEEYVAARMPALLRTAYLLTGQHQDAEDLVQTALVKAVPKWRRIATDPESYVRRILVHENISRWRRRRWREVHVASVQDRPATPDRSTDRMMLRTVLADLAPRQRAVIVLRYLEDLSERDTAELLGISVGTVKSQARDGLARLRVLMPEREGKPAGVPGPTA